MPAPTRIHPRGTPGRKLPATFFAVCLALGAARPAEIPANSDAEARKLYLVKCAKCHKLYDPAKYTDEQWKGWMIKMSKKSRLKPEQREQLSRYIEDTFRHPKTHPDAPGKPAFEQPVPPLTTNSPPTNR